jgi:hypothetical protein
MMRLKGHTIAALALAIAGLWAAGCGDDRLRAPVLENGQVASSNAVVSSAASGGAGTGGAGGVGGAGVGGAGVGGAGVGGAGVGGGLGGAGGGPAMAFAGYSDNSKDSGDEHATAAVAMGDDLVVAGDFDGSLSLGGGSVLTTAGQEDVFVVRLDKDGKQKWSRRFGDLDREYVHAMARAGNDLVVVGSFAGTINFGKQPSEALVASGQLDMFVAKLNGDTGETIWSRSAGGGQNQEALDVVVAANGDVLVTGYFSSTLDLGGGGMGGSSPSELQAVEGEDIFLARLDSSGQLIWSKRFGTTGSQRAAALGTDSSGDILITGGFDGSLNFGPMLPMTNSSGDAFLCKLAGDGSFKWQQSWGGSGVQVPHALAVNSSDEVYVGGSFQGSINIGGNLYNSAGQRDAFVVKVDPSGQPVWEKAVGDTFDQAVRGLALAANGDLVVMGNSNGTVNFGGADLTAVGFTDIFLARLDPTGSHVLSRSYGDANSDEVTKLVPAGPQAFAAVGFFVGDLDFGNTKMTAPQLSEDGFVWFFKFE